MEKFADLIPALCHVFAKSKDDLRLMVKDKFLDKKDFTWPTVTHWVECSTLTSAQYLSAFSMQGALVDGLFLWLASVLLKMHWNFVHKDAIWTLHVNEVTDLMDATIVFTTTGFLACPSSRGVVDKAEQADCFMDPIITLPSHEDYPIVLQKRVHDVAAHSLEVDIEVMGSPHPLHHLLAELCSCSPGKYRIQLSDWIWHNLLHLKMVTKWCSVCGQLVEDYLDHLMCDGPTDGLKVLY